METGGTSLAVRPRAFVGVSGSEAADYLQRMLSNDVEGLAVGASCQALLLTPKARVIAPLRVLRRGENDFLLLTEPELGETVRSHLVRSRFAARADIEPEEHESVLILGDDAEPPEGALALENDDYGTTAFELLDPPAPEAPTLTAEDLERLRIRARTPRFGHELDERVLPAEAGLVDRAVSLTKGCYPGQEPIARLHFRGHANRGLRALRIDADAPPAPDAELLYEGKTVGRVTSAVPEDGVIVALAYVRVEVPEDAVLEVAGAPARPLL